MISLKVKHVDIQNLHFSHGETKDLLEATLENLKVMENKRLNQN
jgi:hypothetical protein